MVAVYGRIVRRLDRAPKAERVNAQSRFFRVVQTYLMSETSLGDARAAFVAAANDLAPPGLVGSGVVDAVKASFDEVGMTAGWKSPECV